MRYLVAAAVVGALAFGVLAFNAGEGPEVPPSPPAPTQGARSVVALRAEPRGLALLNEVGGVLQIELSEKAKPIAEGMLNLVASPEARLVSVRLDAEMFENDEFRPLTPDELATVVFVGSELVLRNDSGMAVRHAAPASGRFTVRNVLDAVERTELETRGKTRWMGGIDVHHVYFEGLSPHTDEGWSINWGS